MIFAYFISPHSTKSSIFPLLSTSRGNFQRLSVSISFWVLFCRNVFVQWLRNNAYSANLFFFPVLLLTASFTCWSVLVSVLCLRTGFPCHNPLPPFKLIRFWYQFETGTWWPWIGAKGRWWMPFLKPGTNGLLSLCYQIAC